MARQVSIPLIQPLFCSEGPQRVKQNDGIQPQYIYSKALDLSILITKLVKPIMWLLDMVNIPVESDCGQYAETALPPVVCNRT